MSSDVPERVASNYFGAAYGAIGGRTIDPPGAAADQPSVMSRAWTSADRKELSQCPVR